MAARGWEERAAVGGVFGRWPQIVGPELAEHTEPQSFEDGILVIAADSTNWATQVRLLASNLVKRLNEDLGARHRAAGEGRRAVLAVRASAAACGSRAAAAVRDRLGVSALIHGRPSWTSSTAGTYRLPGP